MCRRRWALRLYFLENDRRQLAYGQVCDGGLAMAASLDGFEMGCAGSTNDAEGVVGVVDDDEHDGLIWAGRLGDVGARGGARGWRVGEWGG